MGVLYEADQFVFACPRPCRHFRALITFSTPPEDSAIFRISGCAQCEVAWPMPRLLTSLGGIIVTIVAFRAFLARTAIISEEDGVVTDELIDAQPLESVSSFFNFVFFLLF